MRVLHLGSNIASQMTMSVEALRGIGVEARGLAVRGGNEKFTEDSPAVETVPEWLERGSVSWFVGHGRRYYRVLSLIEWADVLHWHFGTTFLRNNFDLWWARFLEKPGVVEFWGSDIRIGEVEGRDNCFFRQHASTDYVDRQSAERSRSLQTAFARAGFECLVGCKSMYPHVQRDLFPNIHLVRQRIPVHRYAYRPPEADKKNPLIVHCPSSLSLKGSAFVLNAIEQLRAKHDFEFRLVHNVSHETALAQIGDADIFVDQLILGAHGIAAVEGMAMGKPVICFVKPSMMALYPPNLPLVSANPDTVTQVLEDLICDGQRRHDLGVRGRAYAEKHHDAPRLAHELTALYYSLLRRRGSRVEVGSVAVG